MLSIDHELAAADQPEPAPRADGSIKSMKKMLQVLECFSGTDRHLTPTQIARRAGLPRATAHRIIQTLRQIGLLDQDRERDEYRLGLKLFALGEAVVGHTRLHAAAVRPAAALARITGELVQLAVFDGRQAVIINRCAPGGGLPPEDLPDLAPAHASACGKIALAFQPPASLQRVVSQGLTTFTAATITDGEALRHHLAAARARGTATDLAEWRAGWHCVAAPIRDRAGQVFAAISLSGPAARMPAERLTALAAPLTETARAISAGLAAR